MTGGEREPVKAEVVRDLLLLCGVSVPAEIVAAQTPQDRVRAARWAAAVHLRASDNTGVRAPAEPSWVKLFRVLDADPDPSATAVGRWADHVARVEGSQRHIGANEVITLELAFGAVMAQQLTLFRMRERFAAALATASIYAQADGAHHIRWVIAQMTRDLLGSDEAYEEFKARFGDGIWEEGTAP